MIKMKALFNSSIDTLHGYETQQWSREITSKHHLSADFEDILNISRAQSILIENITSSNINYIRTLCYNGFLNPRHIVYAHGKILIKMQVKKFNFSKITSLERATLLKFELLSEMFKCFGYFLGSPLILRKISE